MKWMKQLYIGEAAERKEERIKRGIREGRVQWEVYVLLLAEASRQLEIVPSLVLRQPYYKDHAEFTIVGIAKGREESQLLVMQMVQDAMKRLGEPDLYRYLTLRLEEEGVDD